MGRPPEHLWQQMCHRASECPLRRCGLVVGRAKKGERAGPGGRPLETPLLAVLLGSVSRAQEAHTSRTRKRNLSSLPVPSRGCRSTNQCSPASSKGHHTAPCRCDQVAPERTGPSDMQRMMARCPHEAGGGSHPLPRGPFDGPQSQHRGPILTV